jgi:uncharacterized membrane protein/glutaredoxin-related protein
MIHMLYQTKRHSEKTPVTINLLLLFAMGGALLAAVQAILIIVQGDILCLNEGCEVVEKLTTVPPIVFNMAGSAFFLMVFLALWLGARGGRGWLNWARVLLLAGMAAEGVLVGFQYYVAEVFCSYCLIIFSIIAVLNVLMGLRQLIGAVAVFAAVLVAFSSLEFSSRSESEAVILENGIYGSFKKEDSSSELFLFFSSTCPHCEEVIETIDEDFVCSLNFNPTEILNASPLPELITASEYSPLVNRKFLKNLGITEIPVLVVKDTQEMRILRGKQNIMQYLDQNCRAEAETVPSDLSGMSSQQNAFQYITPTAGDDACSVDTDCEEPSTGASLQQ